MKTIKHLCIVFITCLSFWALSALANGTPIKEIVYFGDSLTDNGNLYAHDFHQFPPSPPYYRGRFSDGRTWAENLSDHYYGIYYTTSQNYATGGATTFLHNPFDGFLPVTVGEEIDDYIVRDLGYDKSHTLFVIWSGGNDYLPGSKQVDKDTTHVVTQYMADIEKLVSNGAKNILVLNLPDLGGTPRAIEGGIVKNLHDLTVMHNQKLANALANYSKQHTNIDLHTFDIYSLFKEIINNTAKFNQEHHTHFSNVNTACWQGGSLLYANNNINRMTDELAPNNKRLALMISHSPELMEAYQVGQSVKSGAHPCADPTNYIFWDHIHPTSEVHRSLAEIIEQLMDKNYTFQHNAS
ncbi:MAG: SGNH/GDSL hydrolase family protein [Coxiellaceae bacterium]|nr:SGNH/GDSL hydrolase family protein [Coxiellaceae bacterium]